MQNSYKFERQQFFTASRRYPHSRLMNVLPTPRTYACIIHSSGWKKLLPRLSRSTANGVACTFWDPIGRLLLYVQSRERLQPRDNCPEEAADHLAVSLCSCCRVYLSHQSYLSAMARREPFSLSKIFRRDKDFVQERPKDGDRLASRGRRTSSSRTRETLRPSS